MRILTIVLILATRPCLADLASFSYEGVQIGTTLDDFRQRHPEAKRIATDTFVRETKGKATAHYEFYRGRLYRMSLLYTGEGVYRFGGSTALFSRLERKFGDAPNDVWTEGDLRLVFIARGNGYARIIIEDTAVAGKIYQAAAKAIEREDPGF